MSKKFRLDCKIGFQNTFYTKCISVIIDSIGPSIILRSICCRYTLELPLFVGTHRNCLLEAIPMSTNNICY